MFEIIAYVLIGAVVGTIGTLIGAGGGFILTPILLFVSNSLYALTSYI